MPGDGDPGRSSRPCLGRLLVCTTLFIPVARCEARSSVPVQVSSLAAPRRVVSLVLCFVGLLSVPWGAWRGNVLTRVEGDWTLWSAPPLSSAF